MLAEGNLYEIRRLIDHHPHRIRVECDRPRALAAALAGADHVRRITMERKAVVIETEQPDRCYDELATAMLDSDFVLRGMTSPDNNLGAVFEYLTGDRGRARASE